MKAADTQRGPLTIERLERALAAAAYMLTLDGPVLAPMFEKLEQELATMRSTNDAVARAKKLLESSQAIRLLD